MLDRLRDYQYLRDKYYGFGMRKERRKIERDIKVLEQRLIIYCRIHNIIISKANNDT